MTATIINEILQQYIPSLAGYGATIVGIITAIIAAINTFFGYRLMKLWVTVTSFLAGFLVALFLLFSFTKSIPEWMLYLLALIPAVACGYLGTKFFKIGIFLLCTMICMSVAYFPLYEAFVDPWNWILSLLIGLAAGTLAIFFFQPAIIAITAICGSHTFVTGVIALTGLAPAASKTTTLIIVVVLAICGIVFQFINTKKSH